jgi:hypothetical protein
MLTEPCAQFPLADQLGDDSLEGGWMGGVTYFEALVSNGPDAGILQYCRRPVCESLNAEIG